MVRFFNGNQNVKSGVKTFVKVMRNRECGHTFPIGETFEVVKMYKTLYGTMVDIKHDNAIHTIKAIDVELIKG